MGSSLKLSEKCSINSIEFSILWPYSPMIHTIAARASALSNDFKCVQRSWIIFSNLLGYYLNISLITITISSTTYYAATFVRINSWKARTHLSAAYSNFTAIRPTAVIAFLANMISISYEYSFNSANKISIFFRSASLTNKSNFANLM